MTDDELCAAIGNELQSIWKRYKADEHKHYTPAMRAAGRLLSQLPLLPSLLGLRNAISSCSGDDMRLLSASDYIKWKMEDNSPLNVRWHMERGIPLLAKYLAGVASPGSGRVKRRRRTPQATIELEAATLAEWQNFLGSTRGTKEEFAREKGMSLDAMKSLLERARKRVGK